MISASQPRDWRAATMSLGVRGGAEVSSFPVSLERMEDTATWRSTCMHMLFVGRKEERWFGRSCDVK